MTVEPASSQTRSRQATIHLSGLICLTSIPGVVGPLVAWLFMQNDPEVEPHYKEALNFHLSMLLYGIGLLITAIVLVVSLIGLLLLPVVLIVALVVIVLQVAASIIAATRANAGELYRYPLSLRLVK
ncbi:MAG TPA: DUF4870 domain-containing protein [Acidimicrobiia bacterium]